MVLTEASRAVNWEGLGVQVYMLTQSERGKKK